MSHWEQIREFEKAKLRAESEERSQTTCRAAAESLGTKFIYPSIAFMKKFLTVLAFSSFVLNCYESVTAQTIDSIAELQNSRSLVDGKLYGYLHSSNPSVRSRAVVALANIQDSSSIQFLLPLLNDSNPAVCRSTAFALGQIGNSEAGSHLIERIQTESDSKCVQEIIDA